MTTTYRKYLLLAALPALILAASCTHDDALDGNGDGTDGTPVPVRFTAAIQTTPTPATAYNTTPAAAYNAAYNAASGAAAPATRTAPGADASQTVWTAADRIAVFMLPAGGKIPADTLPDAHNVPYSIDPATGAMTQAVPQIYDPVTDGWIEGGTIVPMYYPSTDDAVDFVAYWPYWPTAENSTPPYTPLIGLEDQTTAEKQYRKDILFSDNARGIRRSNDPVALSFRHLYAKLRLDITLGESLAGGEVTKVTLVDMPLGAVFDVRDGSINKMYPPSPGFSSISCLHLPSPAPGAHATFTALVAPQAQTVDVYRGRKITVTVDGAEYTGSIPDADAYAGNTMYVYPVSVTPHGLAIGAPATDLPWTDAGVLPAGYDLTIADEAQLRAFAQAVNNDAQINGKAAAEARVLQTAPITLTGEWTPIGNADKPFRGAYNGNGHTVTGLILTTPPPAGTAGDVYAGLFGFADGAVLTGIHLRDVRINVGAGSGVSYLYVGSIAGTIKNSTLSLCSAAGTVNAAGAAEYVYAGGITGTNFLYSTISRCRAAAETTAATTDAKGVAFAGGIAGESSAYSFILSCEARGSAVTADGIQDAQAGGIAGRNTGSSLIAFCRTGTNAVTTRNATRYNFAGGLVGDNGNGYLYSCYSRATATGNSAGSNRAGAIAGSSNDYEHDRAQHCCGTDPLGKGTSDLDAVPGSIVYDNFPGNAEIFLLMSGYTGVVESVTVAGITYYPTTTHHDPAATPAHGITPVRVKWASAAWQTGTNTTYPEIDMTYEGIANPAP